MTSGYSGTPLARKLGIGEGATVALMKMPAGFEQLLEPLPGGVTVRHRLSGAPDVVVEFTTSIADLARRIDRLGHAIFPDRSLWIAWPKRSSGIASDITENAIRDLALPLGLVDNKVCAIDETWSGLRLVWRRERRS